MPSGADPSAGGSSTTATASSPPQPLLRSEMVNAAKQFLANPRVRHTPLEEQKAFMAKKGLTEAEILEAMEGANEASSSSVASSSLSSTATPSPLHHHPPSSSNSNSGLVVDFARSALVFGTAGYMVYRFVRSWLLPQLLNVPDPAEERMQRLEEQVATLSEHSRCIAESVTQTLAAVTEQNEQIGRTMMMVQGTSSHGKGADMDRLHAELGIVKSLLLSQHQFPPVPESVLNPKQRRLLQNGGKAPAPIPPWQLDDHRKEEEDNEEDGEDKTARNGDLLNTSNGSSV